MPRDSSDQSRERRRDKNPGVSQAIAAVDGAAPTPPGTARRDNGRTIDDVREAVKTLAETERIARRVLGGTHPLTVDIEHVLQKARAVLRARETPSPRGKTA